MKKRNDLFEQSGPSHGCFILTVVGIILFVLVAFIGAMEVSP